MHKRKRINSGGVAESFAICFGISTLLIILFSVISAVIAYMLDDPTEHIGLFSLASMILAGVVGGISCARIKGDGGVRFAALVALAIVLLMLLINVILSEGRVSGAAFMNYGCYMGIYSLSAFLGKKTYKHRKHK